ncbi:MAG TPA: PDZ domain-containing protein, partial [Gemmatales bacterium]|nr:PDZ domain-containing protein [Gemmatales bacterium]
MRLAVLQIVAGLAIAAAGLVPVVHRNRPFWGLYGGSVDNGPPRIHKVDDDSPAKTAGLRPDDVVLSVNGVSVDNSGMSDVLTALRPGDEARLRVKRGAAEVDVVARGVDPPVAMIYYPTALHPA